MTSGTDRIGRIRPTSAVRRRRLGAALALSVLIGVVVGCGDDPISLPEHPNYGTWVGGRVLGGDQPVSVEVRAYDASVAYDPYEYAAVVRTAADGSFAIPLGPGEYLVGVEPFGGGRAPIFYSAAGFAFDPAAADTIRISGASADTVHCDFRFTRVEVRLTLPAAVEGRRFYVVLEQKLPDGRYDNLNGLLREAATAYLELIYAKFAIAWPGTYRVRVEGQSATDGFWAPGTADPAEADTVRIEPGQSLARYTSDGPSTIAWLSGFAPHNEEDGWVAEPIEAYDAEGRLLARTAPAADGRFSLAFLAARSARIVAGRTVWYGGNSYEDAAEVALTSGDTTRLGGWDAGRLLLRLEREGPLDALGLILRAYDAGGRPVTSWSAGTSGDYLLTALLKSGEWRLFVAPARPGLDDLLPRWHDRASSFSEARPVEVPSGGGTGEATLRLERGGRIRGSVSGPRGAEGWSSLVVTPAEVDTAWALLLSYDFSILGNEPSVFEVRGVPDGEYKLAVARELFYAYPTAEPLRWFGDTGGRDSATVISIHERAVVEGIEIRWP